MNVEAGRRTPKVELADLILELVRTTDVGGQRGDIAGAAMFGAYLQAHRRLKTIRDVAAAEAGPEAFILARSLLSMTSRAIWVDLPVEDEERDRRFERWKLRELTDELDDLEGFVSADVAEARADLREQLALIREDTPIPGDRKLLEEELPLGVQYQHLYRPGSGFVHFRLRHAVDEVRAAAQTGSSLLFERPESELANDALWLSILTYAVFLHAAEKTVQHGLGESIQEAILEPLGTGSE